ncbi:helix-turn-helix transcriptional regulator [Kitasatospora sp. LaBMicrA B282]|uniref:helix-turn-helix transcriptional regulator n=1 Tax=Kitasatospora sp. LaBMicrA B282 TaxID=3420949 RepID=UPI003D0E86CE
MRTAHERLAARDETLAGMVERWRRRLDPNALPGLVKTASRRTTPVTKTEMARYTGVSLRWYSKLENGEPAANFSEDFLERVAFTLRLNEGEKLALFHHALGRAPRQRDPEPDAMAAMDVDMQRMLDMMLPHPAYISDIAWNVVAHNSPSRELYPWVYQPNIMRWSFLFPEAREQMVRWKEDWAAPFLAQIRTVAAQNPDNEQLKELVRDIMEGCPEAQELWDRHDYYVHPDGDVRYMRMPHGGDDKVPCRIMALAPLRNTKLRFIVSFHGA